ncbi:hypothetical protein [Flavobacterium sp.]|uniref:hypothetical protein n=1 Tax=Flavobacterium sp. TaxID=239 RepID=UPI0025F5C7D4|nr:hypothetical protein [Flavobacterium sp.]
MKNIILSIITCIFCCFSSLSQDTLKVSSISDLDQTIRQLFIVTNLQLPKTTKHQIEKFTKGFDFNSIPSEEEDLLQFAMYFDSCGAFKSSSFLPVKSSNSAFNNLGEGIAQLIDKSTFYVNNTVHFSDTTYQLSASIFQLELNVKKQEIRFIEETVRFTENIVFFIIETNEYVWFKNFSTCR